jgi:uncharacterized membrane protein
MRSFFHHRWPLGALFVLGLIVACYRLDAQSLWLDEGFTWAEATGHTGKTLGRLVMELFSPDASYPLYHLGIRGWTALFGASEWALRLPSALAFALTVPLVASAAAELGLSPAHQPRRWLLPLLSTTLILCSPYALWYAQDAKAYSLLMLVCALLNWALLRALRCGGRAWLLALGIALSSVFVHRLAVLTLAGAALGLALVWASITTDRPRTVSACELTSDTHLGSCSPRARSVRSGSLAWCARWGRKPSVRGTSMPGRCWGCGTR